MADEVAEEFETADAGASKTVPIQAGAVRKGGHIVIKGRPCKVIDISTSKTGKHGHAKCKFVALDIFTGDKKEDMQPSSHNMDAPVVDKKEYQVLMVDDEGFVTLMDEDGNQREDLKLPHGTDDLEKLAKDLKDQADAGEADISVTVVSAMGTDMIMSMKVLNS
eukprot:CAMPEP_0119125064 /NCGR_PEP_ID=MMETSP1310-20130426/4466_1 /TAXON_ID=464262 /ORGANISM="Genus nov. species nov., Strain RCC2339" /LENGTH=163 /DNA_ID=CAMNT_0007115091 /DNA_START=58 /DNA_END=549 /DNA_ORIENTATION=+